ncbi:peptide deformylase [Oscillospiraceae bacterium WX1]
MPLRQLRTFQDPDLEKQCRPVADINAHVLALLDDLAETLESLPEAVSLAANQIGILRRLAVVRTDSGIQKLINPAIVEQSGSQEIDEDCLCYKDIEGIMLRPEKIVVEALNEKGEKLTLALEGAEASKFCHLIDHLDGKVLIKQIHRFVSAPLDGEE